MNKVDRGDTLCLRATFSPTITRFYVAMGVRHTSPTFRGLFWSYRIRI
jgi:hypothetical protein